MIGLFLLILDFGGWNLHTLKKKKRFFSGKIFFPFSLFLSILLYLCPPPFHR